MIFPECVQGFTRLEMQQEQTDQRLDRLEQTAEQIRTAVVQWILNVAGAACLYLVHQFLLSYGL